MTEALGWLPHTVRAALSGLRKRGYVVLKKRRNDHATSFRIKPPDLKPSETGSAGTDDDASTRGAA